jgi:hypothetical protein
MTLPANKEAETLKKRLSGQVALPEDATTDAKSSVDFAKDIDCGLEGDPVMLVTFFSAEFKSGSLIFMPKKL